MFSTRQLKLLRHTRTPTGLTRFAQRWEYTWGNYDASSGECCKMRDAETTKCAASKMICKPGPFPNRCGTRVITDDYPVQLKEILTRKEVDTECNIKYDLHYYKPSEKNRRYQRTWAECPYIWLRPKQTCCTDKEYYPPAERRPTPPAIRQLTAVEKFKFELEQLCKLSEMGKKSSQKCHNHRRPSKCKKEPAPYPSFSECDQEFIQRYCPTECACNMKPSVCEMWQMFHHNGNDIKKCTQAIVSPCPFKLRARPLY